MAKKELKINYRLLDTTINIEYVDKIEDDSGLYYGQTEWDMSNVTVKIATKDKNGVKLSKDVLETTLRHELFHVILDKMYFRDESKNETLVEWLAQATELLNKQGLKV